MKLPKLAYRFIGLPEYYHGINYKDTKIPSTKIEGTISSVSKAPDSGVLLVSGTAAPIVNQLLDIDKKCVGVNFVDFYNSRFLKEEDAMDLPKAQVVVIYNVGMEPANNLQYSSKILSSMMASLRNVLVIIETDKSIANFQAAYGLSISNTKVLQMKEADPWMT